MRSITGLSLCVIALATMFAATICPHVGGSGKAARTLAGAYVGGTYIPAATAAASAAIASQLPSIRGSYPAEYAVMSSVATRPPKNDYGWEPRWARSTLHEHPTAGFNRIDTPPGNFTLTRTAVSRT